MRKIVVSNPAQIDLREHFAYLADRNFDTALHFFDSARQTFADLARMPELGSRYPSQKKRFQDLRKWHVKGFNRFLIFYRFNEDTIEIVRILYGTQDIQALLGRET